MGIKRIALSLENAVKSRFLKILPRLLPDQPDTGAVVLDALQDVLLIRPDRLGDFLLAVPMLTALEASLAPKARLTLIIGTRSEQLARAVFPGMKVIAYRKTPFSLLRIMGHLLCHHFDAVINLHSQTFSASSGLMTLAAHSGIRIGFKDPDGSDAAAKIYCRGVVFQDDGLHERDRNFLLLQPLGLRAGAEHARGFPEIKIPPDTQWKVKHFYLRHNLTDDTFVVGLHPTLMKADNRWAQEKYYQLMAQLSQWDKVKVAVIWGREEEKTLKTFLPPFLRPHNVMVLPVNDIFYLLEAGRRFNVLVCNDSGLMHLLSLVTNLVVIWGPSNLNRWSPLGPARRIILRHEDGNCDAVEVDEVMAAVRYFWEDWQEKSMDPAEDRILIAREKKHDLIYARR